MKIETVRAFAYTVINDKVHKGIIFCTGYVPKTLYEYDQRIEKRKNRVSGKGKLCILDIRIITPIHYGVCAEICCK